MSPIASSSPSSLKEGGPGELHMGQPHHDPWESDGTTNPGNDFQAHKGEEKPQEQSAWTHQGEFMPKQPDKLL